MAAFIYMHVQFEFTQEDLIDASNRFLARSQVVRSWRWKNLLYSALIGWLFMFILFIGTPAKGAVLGLIVAVISSLIYPSLHKSETEKRLRELHQELLGDANLFMCEVELLPVGVWVRQINKQTVHEWESVEEIKESANSVDIFTRGGGIIVRKRAFKSPEEQKQFIDIAQGYLELCRISISDDTTQLKIP